MRDELEHRLRKRVDRLENCLRLFLEHPKTGRRDDVLALLNSDTLEGVHMNIPRLGIRCACPECSSPSLASKQQEDVSTQCEINGRWADFNNKKWAQESENHAATKNHLLGLIDLYEHGFPESDEAARIVNAARTWLDTIREHIPISCKQEDDREWEKNVKMHKDGGGYGWYIENGWLWLHRPTMTWKNGSNPEEFAWPTEAEDRADLAKAPHPPDSKPPTQSEDQSGDAAEMVEMSVGVGSTTVRKKVPKAEAAHCCGSHGFAEANGTCPACETYNRLRERAMAEEATKPTESVQPWPEDLSVLVGRTITTRNKCDAPTATRTDVVYRIVDGWIFIDPKGSRQLHIPERDLLSVSPPLSQPQSGQSEGRVRWFRTKINVYKYDGRKMVSYRHTNPTDILDPDPNTLEQVMRDAEEFFPTQPKDSKEMVLADGDDVLAELEVGVEMGERDRLIIRNVINERNAALQSANERAEKAEKELEECK